MALAVGDRVRPRLTSVTPLLSAARLNPQPPVLAVVTRIIATEGADQIVATVADNGITWAVNASNVVAVGVTESALDQITEPAELVREAFQDKVVVGLKAPHDDDVPDIAVQYSNEYVGIVVDVYNVNGVPSVLIRTINSGMYYELPITLVAIVPYR